MKPTLAASIAAVGAFLAAIVIIPVAVILPRLTDAGPEGSVGWDPISLFHWMGWQVLLAAALISALIFFAVERHLSRQNRNQN